MPGDEEDDDEDEVETDEDRLQEIAEEASEGKSVQATIFRVTPSGIEQVWTYRDLTRDAVLELPDTVQAQHGGGRYQAKFRVGGQIRLTFRFAIAGDPKKPEAHPPAPSAPAPKTPRELELERELQAREAKDRELELERKLEKKLESAFTRFLPATPTGPDPRLQEELKRLHEEREAERRERDRLREERERELERLRKEREEERQRNERERDRLREEREKERADREKERRDAEKRERDAEEKRRDREAEENRQFQQRLLDELQEVKRRSRKKRRPDPMEELGELLRKDQLYRVAKERQKEEKSPFMDKFVQTLFKSSEKPLLEFADKVGKKVGEVAEAVEQKAASAAADNGAFLDVVMSILVKNPQAVKDEAFVREKLAKFPTQIEALVKVTSRDELITFANAHMAPDAGKALEAWEPQAISNTLTVVGWLRDTVAAIRSKPGDAPASTSA